MDQEDALSVLVRERLAEESRRDRAEARRTKDRKASMAQRVVGWFVNEPQASFGPLTEGTPSTELEFLQVMVPEESVDTLMDMEWGQRRQVLEALRDSGMTPEQANQYVRARAASLNERAQEAMQRRMAAMTGFLSGAYGAAMPVQPGNEGSLYVKRSEIEAREQAERIASDPGFEMPSLDDADRQAQEIVARQRRLMDEDWVRAYPDEAAKDRAIEQSRLNIAAALSKAVEVGLMDEDRALAMITVGGLNDRDLTAEGALSDQEAADMIARVLQQGVRAGLFERPAADAALTTLGLSEDADPSVSQVDSLIQVLSGLTGQKVIFQDETGRRSNAYVGPKARKTPAPTSTDTEPIYDEEELAALTVSATNNWPIDGTQPDEQEVAALVRAVPRLVTSVYRLVEAIYEAATVEPCHTPSHGQLHQGQGLCDNQYASIGMRIVRSIGLAAQFLPRRRHTDNADMPSACCSRDGNTGTWVRYGQSINPGLTPSRPGTVSAPLSNVEAMRDINSGDPLTDDDLDDELPF